VSLLLLLPPPPPIPRTAALFLGLDAVATTLPRVAATTWHAAIPSPPAAAWMSTSCSLVEGLGVTAAVE
jgi:hypothetical protein